MVFILRLVDPPQTEVAPIVVGVKPPSEKGYKVTLDGPRAIFHDAGKEPPQGIREQPRLTEKHRGDVYVTPCGGVVEAFQAVGDSTTGAVSTNKTDHGLPKSDAAMMSLLGSVQESAAERHNVTIINRGTQSVGRSSGEFFQSLAFSVVGALHGTMERAIQIVADEHAKEKQMQRLLQSDEDGTSAPQMAPKPPAPQKPTGDAVNSYSVKRAALGLSPPVQQKLRTLSAQREKSPRRLSPSRAASARSRFTLLAATSEAELTPPATDLVAGLTPKSFMVKPPDVASSAPSARRGTVDGAGPGGRNAARRQTLQSKKKTVDEILTRFTAQEDPNNLQPIKGNGWGNELRFMSFNGSSSVLALPPIPKFEEFVKSFQIDFWLKTDCKMSDGKKNLFHVMEGQRAEVGMNFQIGLNFVSDFDEHIRLYIRDAQNRVMEVLAPLPNGFTSGHMFHHIVVRVRSLESGKVEVLMDGELNDRLRYVQQEHPQQFNPWPHSRVFIGSYVDDLQTVQQCIRGGISELRLWRGDAPTPFQRWPLCERNSIGKLLEATRSVSEDHPETVVEMRDAIHQPPKVSPYFDGNTVLNLGTMGPFGEFLGNWGVEIRFKTSITGRSMSLMGVTDAQGKMMEFGIVLNAEPVLSKERHRFHEYHITVYLVDSFGDCCSALVRGTERQNVMDDQWHTIEWRVVDSETNKFEVRMDGAHQDILMVYREGPVSFSPLRDFVCVGAHNVRDWKVRNIFTGMIHHVNLSVQGEVICQLPMNEGPGAAICQDWSGRHHHALITHADGGHRRHNMFWIASSDSIATTQEGNGEASSMTNLASHIVIHKSNTVSVAAVYFGGVFDHSGTIQESVVDVFTGKPIDVITSDAHFGSNTASKWRDWRSLPDGVFHVAESAAQVKEFVAAAIQAHNRSGHMLLILRIGDCMISLLDLIGPLVPMHSTFDCNMMKWKYAIAINGTKGKREQLLNNCVVGLERMLIEVSANPNICKRIGTDNALNESVTPAALAKTLQATGTPWRLALVMHGNLLNFEYASHLHMVTTCPRIASEEEAASVAIVARAIQKSAEERAALLIQRNYRGKLARNRVLSLEQQRRVRKQQVEEIMSLRRANPLVQPKKNLRAIIIAAHEFSGDMLPPITSFNSADIGEVLKRQGYNVEHLKNPSRAAISKVIGSIEPDSCTFVYISGYGGAIRVRQPPVTSHYRLHLAIEEGGARASIELQAVLEYAATARAFFAGMQEVLRQEAAKNAKKQAGKKANAKNAAAQAQQQRHVEETFRVAREELLKEETELRTLKLQKEYEAEVAAIQKELRQVVSATLDFEEAFRPKKGQMSFFIPSDVRSVEPFGTEVFNIDDLVYRALQRQLPPMGFQAVVAVDVVPLTAGASGLAVLAGSTGHTLKYAYQPEQRHVLSWVLKKALLGHAPRIAVKNREAILQGAVETPETQRDWRSFATYITNKVIPICNISAAGALVDELQRETPYTADLVPVRQVAASQDQKERMRRDLESKRGQATITFAVDSLKVTSDMNGEFKSFIQHATINETINLSTVLLSFLNHNQGIDGIRMDAIAAEVDRCAPANSQEVKYALSVSAQGLAISFNVPQQGAGDKQRIQQWINSIAARSISWRIPTKAFSSRKELEVERIELLFAVKVGGNNLKLKHLTKQRLLQPTPYPTIRFFGLTME